MTKMMEAIKRHADLSEIMDLADTDLMQTNDKGQTALMIAIQCNYFEAAEFLLCEAGHFDNTGKNAYMYAFDANMQLLMSQIEDQHAAEEVEVLIPGSQETVWQYVKQQVRSREQVPVHVPDVLAQFAFQPEQTFQLKANPGIDPFSVNLNPTDFQIDLQMPVPDFDAPSQAPPGILNLSVAQSNQRQSGEKFVIVAELALLSTEQLLHFQQADYFFQAVLAGFGNQNVIESLKRLLDADIKKCLCKKHTLKAMDFDLLLG